MGIGMEKLEKNKISFIISVLILIIFSASCLSLDIALTPGSVDFGSVLRNGFSQGSFTFTTYSQIPITVILYKTQTNNPMDNWIFMHLSNGTEVNVSDILTLDKNHPLKIFVTFEPSFDAPNGNYQTRIGATIAESDNSSNISNGQTLERISAGVSVTLSGKIEDVERLSCVVSDFQINTPELGESIMINSKIKNTGNIYINPKIDVEIWDSQKTKMIQKFDGNLGIIKPTISSGTEFDIDSGLFSPGDYIASVSFGQCNVKNQLMTFKILDVGSTSMDGRIKDVSVSSVVYGYNPIPIKVTFENLGADTVARSYCEVYKDNVMIYPVISESTMIKSMESVDIPVGYFAPSQTENKEDRYVLTCRVHYGTKDTLEYSKVFFVDQKQTTTNLNVVLIIGMIVIIIILLIFIMLRKKK